MTAPIAVLTQEQLNTLLEAAALRGAELALEAQRVAPTPGLVAASEMCRRLGVSRTTLHRLRTEQGAPAVRVGDVYKYESEAVIAWFRDRAA